MSRGHENRLCSSDYAFWRYMLGLHFMYDSRLFTKKIFDISRVIMKKRLRQVKYSIYQKTFLKCSLHSENVGAWAPSMKDPKTCLFSANAERFFVPYHRTLSTSKLFWFHILNFEPQPKFQTTLFIILHHLKFSFCSRRAFNIGRLIFCMHALMSVKCADLLSYLLHCIVMY